jgi:ABC-2 type transport system ATP-binding protein/lipopolysaccharide transport system ATP-binding protein
LEFGALVQIILKDVTVDFPIATMRARSLKNRWLSMIRHVASAEAITSRVLSKPGVGGRIVASSSAVESVRALDSISFDLHTGDRLGLVGPNGAGKTTLIRLLAGIYGASSGSMLVEGQLVPMFDISIGFDGEATGLENVYIRGLMMGLSESEIRARTDEIVEFSGLADYIHLPIRTYSSGMLLRLMFSIATSIRGDIVLMDEWIAVGDESFRAKANERLDELTAKAGILVIASHDPGILRRLCTKGLRLEAGQVMDFGPIEDVLSRSTSGG